MKIAVISDIHGNFEALCAVVEDVFLQRVDRVISLGDNVGYGPDAEQVTQFVSQLGFDCILGNHEMALLDPEVYDSLNFQAQENNLQIRTMLSEKSLAYYQAMPLSLHYDDMHFVHGFPPDSVTSYLFEVEQKEMLKYFQHTENYVCFVGHTHRLSLTRWDGVQVTNERLTEGKHSFSQRCRYIVNAGSVGQPRDKDNSAKYVRWDSEKSELEVRFVPYDPRSTIEKIEQLGFPQAYALRLK